MDEIQQFIDRSFRSLINAEEGESQDITELEDYLPIPADLLPDDDDETKSKGFNPQSGDPGNLDENGTYATTETETPREGGGESGGSADKGEVTAVLNGGSSPSGLQKTGGVHQRESGKKKKRGSESSPGKKRTIQSFNPNLPGKYTQVVDVDFSVLAKTTNGNLWHDIFINADEDYPDVQMTVVVCGEGSDEKLDIAESSVGTPSENTLSGFSLKAGINKVSIRFRDNVKHTLTLEVYED